MSLSNAERQRRYREKKRQRGLKQISFSVSQEEFELLHMAYENMGDRPATFDVFLRTVLMRGAVFATNSGGNMKIRRENNRYIVTKKEGKDV